MVQPFTNHRNTSSCMHRKHGIAALSSSGHTLATRSISLFRYLYKSDSPTICTCLSLHLSLSIPPYHLFCPPLIYLSLSLLLPFVSPSFPRFIPPLSHSVLKCLIWIRPRLMHCSFRYPGQTQRASHQLCGDQSVCTFTALFASAKRLTDYPCPQLTNVYLS